MGDIVTWLLELFLDRYDRPSDLLFPGLIILGLLLIAIAAILIFCKW